MAFQSGVQLNNQLQFNLNVPSKPQNVMTQFKNPGPIILEKVLPAGNKLLPQKPQDRNFPSVKMTDASKGRLAWALQLARRDLKNMIHQQRASEENAKKQNVVGKKKRTKTTKKLSAVSKVTKVASTQPTQNVFKKSVKTQTPPTKQTYFSRRGLLNDLPPGSAQKLQTERWRSPARPREQGDGRQRQASPPAKLSPSSRQGREIKKLRNELKFYVQRIEKLTKEAQYSLSSSKEEEDEKYLLRREVKRAEQTSRSSRLLYSLQQQVRELQDDLKRMGPEKIKHTKRSQILSRLAAAHRGAVRILQAFLHQLPDQVSDEGTLPPIYQELGQLINKLSLCTSHLEVDRNGFPEDVLQIFEKFQTPQPLEHRSPRRRRTLISPDKNSRRKLEFGKNLFTARDDQREKPTVSPLSKEYLPCHPISPTKHYGPGQEMAQRVRTDAAKQIATPGSPERNAAIKAGLEALMRIDEPEADRMVRTKSPKPRVRVPVQRGKKGVLLPPKPKVYRGQPQKPKPAKGPRNAGYLQGTTASRLKGQEARKAITDKAKLDGKPPWAPPGSPRSFHQSPKSPVERRERLDRNLEEDEEGHGPPRLKRVLFEDEGIPVQEGDGIPRHGIGSRWEEEQDIDLSGYRGESRQLSGEVEAMIGQAERAILERLQPLLDKADKIAREQELSQHSGQDTVQEKLARRMTEKVTDHAGLISDLILEDVIDDTAQEMEGIDRDREIGRTAGSMGNASNYETMLQELERMEAEEENIRRRWRKVAYYDPLSKTGIELGATSKSSGKRGIMMGRPLEGELLEWIDDVPVDYTGIELTNNPPASGRTITIVQPDLSQYPISDDEESVEDRSQSSQQEDTSNHRFKPSEAHSDWLKPSTEVSDWLKPSEKIELRVPPSMEKRVTQNRQSFEDYLKRKSHLVYGDFDPWKLVTEVADGLVDRILQDIAGELAECSSGFMDALYKAEFEDAAAVNSQ